MALSRTLRRRSAERADPIVSFTDWNKMFRPGGQVSYGGQQYQAFQTSLMASLGGEYYDQNSVVYACATNRILLFSEARFQFQQMRKGRPGDLFGNEELSILEEPWPGATTGDLLTQAELDVAMHGNSYWVNDGPDFMLRLDPSRVTLLTEGRPNEWSGYMVGDRLVAYAYDAGTGPDGKPKVQIYLPGEVAHYKPHPDKDNRFIGMSWLTPCLEDILSDEEMTTLKVTNLRNRGNLDVVVTIDKTVSPEQFKATVDAYYAKHVGPENAGRPLFISGGVDVKTIGQTFEQMSMRATQGAGETRIAACAGVPPVIVGLSEGLSAATYSNYSQARRRLVDGTMRPLWRFFAGAMQAIVEPPTGSRLWYDDRDIPFLREDVKDQAEILGRNAGTAAILVNGGWEPDSVIDAVTAGDLKRLVGAHTGLNSVQLQPAATSVPDAPKALSAAPTK